MTAPKAFDARTVTTVLNVLAVLGLVACVVVAGVQLKAGYDAVQLSTETARLAAELRQSSDDLTRFIRTYTVTGNASYWGYFQQVIGIRNGALPLPHEPWRNHWDLFISDGVAPRGYGAPHALLDRIRAAGFPADELALLTEAARQSDALIDLEDVAYHAMNGRYRPRNATGLTEAEAKAFSVPAAPNQTLAMELVHGTAYHQWKGRIMRPIDEFAARSSARVERIVQRNFDASVALICVLAAMLVRLIAVLLIYFLKVSKDSQTQHLLSAVLPERVVDAVSISQFHDLRMTAANRAKVIRGRRASLAVTVGIAAGGHDFPVLYSEYLPMAWVAFTDIVGFTKMCRYTESNAVIALLNELFSMLDIAAAQYRVEKIKTIGDAFMAAKLSTSELHIADGDGSDDGSPANASRVARDGLEIVQFLLRASALARGCGRPPPPSHQNVEDLMPSGTDREPSSSGPPSSLTSPNGPQPRPNPDEYENPFLELRMGLHAGPCASGIVGFERPLYDLFGDTVNTAARLEATGRPGQVHVLESTVPLFGKHVPALLFDGMSEVVALKGLGTAPTRFVMGMAGGCRDLAESTLSGSSAYRRVDSNSSITSAGHDVPGSVRN